VFVDSLLGGIKHERGRDRLRTINRSTWKT